MAREGIEMKLKKDKSHKDSGKANYRPWSPAEFQRATECPESRGSHPGQRVVNTDQC